MPEGSETTTTTARILCNRGSSQEQCPAPSQPEQVESHEEAFDVMDGPVPSPYLCPPLKAQTVTNSNINAKKHARYVNILYTNIQNILVLRGGPC